MADSWEWQVGLVHLGCSHSHARRQVREDGRKPLQRTPLAARSSRPGSRSDPVKASQKSFENIKRGKSRTRPLERSLQTLAASARPASRGYWNRLETSWAAHHPTLPSKGSAQAQKLRAIATKRAQCPGGGGSRLSGEESDGVKWRR